MRLERSLHDIDMLKLRKSIEKNASFWEGLKAAFNPQRAGSAIGDALFAAGGAASIAAAAHGIGTGVGAIKNKIEKGRAYKGMLETTPGLSNRDAGTVQKTFNTLWNLNKDLAKDPLTAGSFVERSVGRADLSDSAGAYVDIETARNLLRSAPPAISPITESFIAGGLSALPSKAKDYKAERELETHKAKLREVDYDAQRKFEDYKAQLRKDIPSAQDWKRQAKLEKFKQELSVAGREELNPDVAVQQVRSPF